MTSPVAQKRGVVPVAIVVSGGAIAQLVLAKATRDALFLASFDVRLLPRMMLLAAAVSMLSAWGASFVLSRSSPARVLPMAFAVSAALYLAEWLAIGAWPTAAVITLYLHAAAFSSTLVAGFWAVVNESLDPYSAKRHFGRISMGGTVGGAVAGLAGWQVGGRVGAPVLLPALSIVSLGCAVLVVRLARRAPPDRRTARGPRNNPGVGARALVKNAYLGQLAALVAITSMVAALLDYVLSARVSRAMSGGEELVTFFALFHMAVGVGSFLLQALASRPALERFGIASTVALLPIAVLVGGVVGIASSRLWAAVVLRGAEALMASSLYRAAYELLYTPVPRAEKRPAKMLIDVGVNRVGAVVGSAVVMAILYAVPRGAEPALIVLAMLLAVVCVLCALRLHRGYVRALEQSLKSGAVELSSAQVFDAATRRTLAETTALDRRELLRAIEQRHSARPLGESGGTVFPEDRPSEPPVDSGDDFSPQGDGAGFVVAPRVHWQLAAEDGDDLARALTELRSGDRMRIRAALERHAPLPPELVPVVIDLLGRDDVCRSALASLQQVAEKNTGQLVDALLDRDRDEVLRHRIPRALEAADSKRAVRGLVDALFEPELEVRYQAVLALLRITERHPDIELPRDRIVAAAAREVELGRKAWSEKGLAWNADRADEKLRVRTDRGMEYAICVLSLVLDREPLQIAYRALFSDDEVLRGTAIEYFDNVLPEEIKEAGMAFIGIARPVGAPKRKLGDLEAELLLSRA